MIVKDIYIQQGVDQHIDTQIEVLTNPLLPYCIDTNPFIPLDLSGYTAKMTIHADYYSPALLTFTNIDYIALTNLGWINTSIAGDYTNSITLPDEDNEYVYQLEIMNTVNDVKGVRKGKCFITKNLNI
jgi:hypothetical protein